MAFEMLSKPPSRSSTLLPCETNHYSVVCYALMIVMPVIQFAWYRYENNRRDRLAGSAAGVAVDSLEFTDKTDFQQWETFRYAM